MNFLTRALASYGVELGKGYTGYVDTNFWVRALSLSEALSASRTGGLDISSAYQTDAIVYAAISSCAVNLSQVPFQFFTGDDASPTLIEHSPWDAVFERPNPMMSRFQLWEATEIFLKLRGECLWVLEFGGARPNGNIPLEIYPQDPALFRPLIDPLSKTITAWAVREENGDELFFEHGVEVIQFKKYNPYDRYRGLPPLQAAGMALKLGQSARSYNDVTMQNMGEPGGVLSTDQPLTAETVMSLREQFEARHQGPNKAKRLAVLHSGLKYQQIAMSPKDVEFVQGLNLSIEDILAVLKVPKTEVFRYDDIRKETSEVQDKALWTKNLLPEMAYIEDVLWAELFSKRGDRRTWGLFQTDNIPALQDDIGVKATTAKIYFDMGWPINQINKRFKLGMEDVEWGDEGYLPFNLAPASTIGTDAPLPESPTAPPPDDGDGQDPEDSTDEAVDKALKITHRPVLTDSRSVRRRSASQQFLSGIKPLEAQFARRLKRYFFELRQDVLQAFHRENRSIAQKAFSDEVASILDAAKRKLKSAAEPYIRLAIENGIDRMAEFDIEFAVSNPAAVALLQQRTGKITRITDTVESQLRAQLSDGYSAHESVIQLAERLRTVFNFASSRSLMIARTEMSNASNAAAVLAEKDAGVERHEWATAGDEAVRDSHAAQDGEIAKVGEAFRNGLEFPGDPTGPPEETVNCRCAVVPLID